MRNNLFRFVIFISVVSLSHVFGQAPLPAIDLRSITEIVQRDFSAVDAIRTVGMTDAPDGRFDLIVVGSRPRSDGWRVEVISVSHHKVTITWDSVISANDPEFENSGAKSVTISIRDYDYNLFIEGCVPHMCHDGVSGFLMFTGATRNTVKARVVTQGLDGPFTAAPKYNVSFSGAIDESSKTALEKFICRGRTIGNKAGLPFACDRP